MRFFATLPCLALFPLAGLVTVAAAQQGAADTRERSAIVRPAESESTLMSARSAHTVQCEAQIDFEFFQRAEYVRAEGRLTNDDCAASGGDYTINIRVRDESGSINTISFVETWRRDDDQPVIFGTDYPIGQNVDAISVGTRNGQCTCADTPENAAAFAIAGAADAQSPAEDGSASVVFRTEDNAEPLSRRELRRRIRAAEASAAVKREDEVCRTEQVTGSRMPSTTCATEEEWEAWDAQIERDTQDLLRRSRENTVGLSTASPVQ